MSLVYAFGSNGSGQLGLSHADDICKPQLVKGVDRLAPVKRIVAGGNHTLVLLEDNAVYATGNNEDGRTGLHAPISKELRPILLRLDNSTEVSRFYDVAATWSASFFVAMDRRTVYVCGTGDHGELGLGPDEPAARYPQMIQLPDTIESMASCLSHVVVLLSNGEIWGWGKGRKGQLGEPREDVWTPRRIAGLAFVPTRAVCGADFTCVFGAQPEGKIAVLGSDQKDRFRLRADVPSSLASWVDVTASWGSVLVQTRSGIVAWGRNDRGQLPPAHLPAIRTLTAGSEHWLALTTDGQVLSGGWGEHGNCGEPTDDRGIVQNRWNVIDIDKPITRIFAGCATSFLIASSG